MLFNTVEYGVFLVAVLVAFWLLAGRRVPRHVLLLAASYFFYGSWNVRYLGLILFSTMLDYAVGLALHHETRDGRRRWLLVASLVGNLGVLAVFKYYNFFAESLAALLGLEGVLPHLNVLLPVGISFYTFQTLSYTIDIYRRKLEPTHNLIDFAVFVAFFPQLVAGPIVRASHFLPQLKRQPVSDNARVNAGLYLILTGLFKKIVIADFLGSRVVDPVFSNPGDHGAADILLAVYAYALQIYGDFSGYSDIAIGSARLLGFDIPENFRSPYRATSLRDFWRRWHISLSTWLRDYLYIPLGGSRHGPWCTYAALFVTMLLGGLWHGAAWTFVAWGVLHGVGLAVTRMVQRTWPRLGQSRSSRILGAVVTFHLVCLGWMVFRAPDFATVLDLLAGLTRWQVAPMLWLWPSLTVVVVGFVSHLLPRPAKEASEVWFGRVPATLQAAALVIALAFFQTMSLTNQPFIYFQF